MHYHLWIETNAETAAGPGFQEEIAAREFAVFTNGDRVILESPVAFDEPWWDYDFTPGPAGDGRIGFLGCRSDRCKVMPLEQFTENLETVLFSDLEDC